MCMKYFSQNGNEDDTFVVYSKGKDGKGTYNKTKTTFTNDAIGAVRQMNNIIKKKNYLDNLQNNGFI